ncbi:MAG: hypothetical protein ABF714_11145, partial [Novacetimonas hansenii]|uniref:hypothetical protein n=1 Tax=Novacetimonas hansenii TaxID=436 RepID=UPI0039EB338D
MQGLAFWTFSLRGGQAAVIRVRSHGAGHAPGTVAGGGGGGGGGGRGGGAPGGGRGRGGGGGAPGLPRR